MNNNRKKHPVKPIKFFVISDSGDAVPLPKEVTGMHLLSRFLLNTYVESRGYKSTQEGKYKFLKEVLDADINKQFSAEEAVFPLAAAIKSVFELRRNTPDRTINARDSSHVEFGIRKELETVLIAYDRIRPAV